MVSESYCGTPVKGALKSIAGIVCIGSLLIAIGWFVVSRSEKLARYDCYVWEFNHALCRNSPALEKSQRYDRCTQHLKPVPACQKYPETERGISDALRYIKGESVELPPGNRDYRTFHVWGK